MRNKIYILILIIITVTLSSIIFKKIYDSKKGELIDINQIVEIEKEVEIKKEEKKENWKSIDDFKKEIISKWLVIRGDIHLKNDDYIFALQKFTKANKKTPNNPKILGKIAETYFLMKNFKLAHRYYSKITDNNDYKEKIALSFLYKQEIESIDFEKTSSWTSNSWSLAKIAELKQAIKDIWLEKDEEFYYLNSLECLDSFYNCKINFDDYFKNKDYSAENQNLENIREAINNYNNLKLDEPYYKDTYIIGAFFENQNYPIAIVLAKKMLEEKKSYKVVLKIIAQSYFELNRLGESNKYLLEYARIDSKSPDVYYMIGVISQKNNDYIKSNIFLNLALEQNYKNVENIYRLQLYNYLILEQKGKIIDTFDKLIALKEKPDFNDLILATYYNVVNWNIEKAILLTDKWLELYPEKEDFYWFKAWLQIEKGRLDEAEILLEKAKEINSTNALVMLNLWRISKIKYEKDRKSFDKIRASILFKRTVELDSAEIWELAKKYLKEIED